MKIRPALASWLQVGPLAVMLALFFGLPMLVVIVVSFFDFDHTDIVPTFILDNYVDMFTSDVTLRLYVSSIKFAVDRLGDHAGDRLHASQFPGVPRPQPAVEDRPVPAVLGAVLDLERSSA